MGVRLTLLKNEDTSGLVGDAASTRKLLSMSFVLNFDALMEFEPARFRGLESVVGIYFICLESKKIAYPFKDSRLIYIGMSERKTNSVATRLQNHFDGRSGNFGLQSYKKVEKLKFTYLNIDVLQKLWKRTVEDFESYLLLDFVAKFGVYPICNNKTGFPDFTLEYQSPIMVDWDYFN